jgi:hypothetical protein
MATQVVDAITKKLDQLMTTGFAPNTTHMSTQPEPCSFCSSGKVGEITGKVGEMTDKVGKMTDKVDKFFFPVDFIILETKPVPHPKRLIPIILGCPFLATANVCINCWTGVMEISFRNMKVRLNIFIAF